MPTGRLREDVSWEIMLPRHPLQHPTSYLWCGISKHMETIHLGATQFWVWWISNASLLIHHCLLLHIPGHPPHTTQWIPTESNKSKADAVGGTTGAWGYKMILLNKTLHICGWLHRYKCPPYGVNACGNTCTVKCMTVRNMFQRTCIRRKYLSCCDNINAHIQKDTCTI